MQYQYIGLWHTYISLVVGEEKVKVVNGEIVESERDEKLFTRNGFQKVEEVKVEKKSKK